MATVVGVLDQDSWRARTDNIVVVDPSAKSLIWVPRDLWCPALHDRINEAFAFAGFAGLLHSLRDLGIKCDNGLVLRRSATELAAKQISLEVPVEEPLDFLYPLVPSRPIEEGHKAVSFRPPTECLTGERIHQWVGARMSQDGKRSDLDRIRRQQIFLRALLEQSFDFTSVIADPSLVRMSDKAALEELAFVDSSWTMQAIADVRYETIFGKSVLVKRTDCASQFGGSAPTLAVVMLSWGTPTGIVDAVRSLMTQQTHVEVVVVNSGGKRLAKVFDRHGINVPVIERRELLNPGEARNLGIQATTAPFVAFLAADCLVRADWSRRRVFFHKAGVAAIGSTLANAHPDNPLACAAHFVDWPARVSASLRGGVSYDRRLFENFGLFREDLPRGEEREFHDRLPAELRPSRKVKIRTLRLNPTHWSQLLWEAFQRGAREGVGHHPPDSDSTCRVTAWHVPLGRALRAYRKAKKKRGAILLALFIIPVVVFVRCAGRHHAFVAAKHRTNAFSNRPETD